MVSLVRQRRNHTHNDQWICSGDINNITGKICLDIANLRAGMHIERVESAANIADGPTRDFMVHVNRFKAHEVPPVMPRWIVNIWQPILSLGL